MSEQPKQDEVLQVDFYRTYDAVREEWFWADRV